jgi:hypothetical protein
VAETTDPIRVEIRRGTATTPELVAVLEIIAARLRQPLGRQAVGGSVLNAQDETRATWLVS